MPPTKDPTPEQFNLCYDAVSEMIQKLTRDPRMQSVDPEPVRFDAAFAALLRLQRGRNHDAREASCADEGRRRSGASRAGDAPHGGSRDAGPAAFLTPYSSSTFDA